MSEMPDVILTVEQCESIVTDTERLDFLIAEGCWVSGEGVAWGIIPCDDIGNMLGEGCTPRLAIDDAIARMKAGDR